MAITWNQALVSDLTGGSGQSGSTWDHYGRMGLIGSDEAVLSQGLGAQPMNKPLSGYDTAFTLVLTRVASLDTAKRDPADRLYFPVSPEDIAVGHSVSHQAYDILNARQTTQIGQPALRTVSFSSFFPAMYDSSYCVGDRLDRTPQASREWMINVMNERRPVFLHFVPGDGAPNVVAEPLECFISSFIPTYKAGHPLDVFFDVDLIEHRAPTVARARWRTANPKYPKNAAARTTRANETLLAYAKRVYGAEYGDGWRLIVAENPRSGPKGKPQKYQGIPTSAAWQKKNPKRKRATRASDRLMGGIVLTVPRYRES